LIATFLAKRYLLASRRDAQVGVVAVAAFLGLLLGVAALVISVALLAGFQRHIRGKLLAETPHLLVTPAGRDAFHADDRIPEKIAAAARVLAIAPVARGRAWLSFRDQAAPIEATGRARTMGLELDVTQARPLGVLPGDTVTLVSSRSRLSPLGPVPIVTSMTVGKLTPLSTGRRAAEASLPLAEARRLFALGDDGATGYEVQIADPAGAAETARSVTRALSGAVTCTTWEEANRALVLALRLERIVLFATVFLIVIVAGLNLAATAAVLAATRAGDAAMLSVLGATPRTVASVFIAAGGAVGAAGTLAGALLGACLAVALDRTGAIPLPAQLYALTHVPFRVEAGDLLGITALSIGWSFAVAAWPARTASRRNVAEVLRG
jgi:lipoprotein-releasing system permease protein